MADKIDNKAFAEMEYATADKTAIDLLGDKSRVTKENVHDMLMVAGFTPGLGNIADAADALLYAAEGEFGSAALSAAAMIPFIGQAVSAKKALKIAKESGEKMIPMYRGVPDWYRGKMVKSKGGERFFVSPEETKGYIPGVGMARSTDLPEGAWLTNSKIYAEGYASQGWSETLTSGGGMKRSPKYNMQTGKKMKPSILKFEVPESWLNKKTKEWDRAVDKLNDAGFSYEKGTDDMFISGGIPTAFLTKVIK